MKKMIKGLFALVVVVIVVVIAALAVHPLWVGPLVKAVVSSVGPKYTGTPVALADCRINLYSGHVELTGFDLANPEGCSERTAAGVSSVKVDLDTLSALSDVVNVRSIEVSGVFVSYVKSASGKYNFSEIGENAKAASSGTPAQSEKKPDETAPASAQKPGKKVVIGRLSVGDVKFAVMGVKIPLLPGTIVLTDVGKKSNGATLEEVRGQVWEQMKKSGGATARQLESLMAFGSEYGQKGLDMGKQGLDLGKKGLGVGTEGVKKALDSAKQLDVKSATEAIKGAGDSIKDVGKGLKGLFGK